MTDVLEEPTTEIPIGDPWMPERDGAKLTEEQMAEKSEDFPYGRRADGTPRAKPGPRGGKTSGPARPRMASAPGPKKPGGRPSAKAAADYRPGIMGILQIPTMALSVIGRQTKNPALQADGMALAMHAPGIAEALNETAKHQPQVARALDNIMKAGPYGAILAAVVPLALQLAANHKLIPANTAMGVHAPEDLVAASNEQMAAMAAGV